MSKNGVEKDGVIILKGKEYITAGGLQARLFKRYEGKSTAIKALLPTTEEVALVRSMMGLQGNSSPLVVMRGEVWVEGFEHPFVDYGTASPLNLRGYIKFEDYPLEMASRRATNRALRLATATGMTSVDELPGDGNGEDPGEDRNEWTDEKGQRRTNVTKDGGTWVDEEQKKRDKKAGEALARKEARSDRELLIAEVARACQAGLIDPERMKKGTEWAQKAPIAEVRKQLERVKRQNIQNEPPEADQEAELHAVEMEAEHGSAGTNV